MRDVRPYEGWLAVGVVRVSEVGKRDRNSDSFVTKRDQLAQFDQWCGRMGARMVKTIDEIDVSGKLPLSKRKGLLEAIELIESGQAAILLFAYYDRSFRNLDVQTSVLARVVEAGGATFACDFGEIRFSTPTEKFATVVQGAANQLYSDQAAYKAMNTRRDRIAQGIPTYSRLCMGYMRGPDRRVVVDPMLGPLVTEMFSRRANGASLREIQKFLASKGASRSYSSIKATLRSPMVLGELHAGPNIINLSSHEPLVDRITWKRVQETKIPRGRLPIADGRLLGKLGVLRCSGCGHAMVSGAARAGGKTYRTYVCGNKPDCPRPVSMSASLAENLVATAARDYLAGMRGSASVDSQVREAEAELAQAQEALDEAVDAFEGIRSPNIKTKLQKLQDAVDRAFIKFGRLKRSETPLKLVDPNTDWDTLEQADRRDLLRAIFQSVTVLPSTGNHRPRDIDSLRFEFFVE